MDAKTVRLHSRRVAAARIGVNAHSAVSWDVLQSRMPFILVFPVVVLIFFCTLIGLAPSHREQFLLLGPGQTSTSIALTADNEKIKLLGAKTPVQVTLTAPAGKVFKVSELPRYTFQTQAGQRHNWRFDLLDQSSMKDAGAAIFRMTTQSATHAGLRSNEQPVRQGKHNTHVHSYYLFQANESQGRMQVNLGEYLNPGVAYFHTTGRAPSFDVVLDAPVGEVFAWPQTGASFENNHEGVRAPADARTQRQYTMATGPQMHVSKFWLIDANGTLYTRSVGVQYARVP